MAFDIRTRKDVEFISAILNCLVDSGVTVGLSGKVTNWSDSIFGIKLTNQPFQAGATIIPLISSEVGRILECMTKKEYLSLEIARDGQLIFGSYDTGGSIFVKDWLTESQLAIWRHQALIEGYSFLDNNKIHENCKPPNS